MLKRRPLSIPYEDQVPLLAALLRESPQSGAPAPADPYRFVAAARHHRLVPYVAKAIEAGEVDLPRALRKRLLTLEAVGYVTAATLRAELPDLVPILEGASGVPPACIKGPAIAERFYPDPGLRPFIDLDLLVPPPTLTLATDALRELGFEVLEEFRPDFAARHGHDVHLVKRTGRQVDVELHWRVGDDPSAAGLDHARLSSARLSIDGVDVAVPDRPAQLLCMAVHLLGDRGKRLIWLQDIALISASASEEEWLAAFELARETRLTWVLHRALDYAARHLGYVRPRPTGPGPKPAWGPLRAVEELDVRASVHVGRLALLTWPERIRYLRDVLIPSMDGLRGTADDESASTWRLIAGHVRTAVRGLLPRRH